MMGAASEGYMSLPYNVKVAIRNLHTAEQSVIDEPEVTERIFDEIVGVFDPNGDTDDWQENLVAALERQGYQITHPAWA